MKSSEQKRKWISLLLAGILGISGGMDIWANDNLEITEKEIEAFDVAELSQNEMTVSDNAHSPLLEDLEELSGDTVSSQMDKEKISASENEADSQLSVSDNIVSLNDVHNGQFSMTESEQIVDAEELHKRLFNVVLPTEVPFKMILFGSKRLEGLIDSEQFCVENRGYEDVCISFQGFCRGENNEDYVINNSSVDKGIVEGKKNIWIYLRWENQKGETLEQPGIVMGDAAAPGEGEIVLKAPKRNAEGRIVGENSESKAYFTFKGDMISDTGKAWREGEIELDLNFSIRTIEQAENKGFTDDVPATGDKSAISKQPAENENDINHGKDSKEIDKNTVLDDRETVSLNEENDEKQSEDDAEFNEEFSRMDEDTILDGENDAEWPENDVDSNEEMNETVILNNKEAVSLNED